MTLWRDTRGTALLEAAVTIPLLLLVSVGIFEFGRAYQTWQVLTNAAREGARIAVLPNSNANGVETRVRQYMQDGQLPGGSHGCRQCQCDHLSGERRERRRVASDRRLPVPVHRASADRQSCQSRYTGGCSNHDTGHVAALIEGIYPLLGMRIPQFRLQRDLTQEQLGAQLHPPVTRASIANIEAGKQRVLVHTVLQIAKTLEAPLEDLLAGRPRTLRVDVATIAAELHTKLNLPSAAATALARRVEAPEA